MPPNRRWEVVFTTTHWHFCYNKLIHFIHVFVFTVIFYYDSFTVTKDSQIDYKRVV